MRVHPKQYGHDNVCEYCRVKRATTHIYIGCSPEFANIYHVCKECYEFLDTHPEEARLFDLEKQAERA